MTSNQLKRLLKRVTPPPLLAAIQSARRARYVPPPEIEQLRQRFTAIQSDARDEITLRPNLTLRIDPESRMPFEWFCFRSTDMVRELDLFVKEAMRFDSFVDVGANHGIFALVFAKLRPGGRVLAVDPSPLAYEVLTRNRAVNGFTNMETRNIACGESRKSILMKHNWHHLEAVSLDSMEAAGAVAIDTIPLDDLCAEHDLWPKLLKIDVEGFELPVLRGATRTLQNAELLFLEIHPEYLDQLRFSQEAIFDLLESGGWILSWLSGGIIERAVFVDQIHTFWLVGRKRHAAA